MDQRRYRRYFIILDNEAEGFHNKQGKNPKGYTKIEIKNGKGVLSHYIQNIKYFDNAEYMYMGYLIGTKDGKEICADNGTFLIDENGKGELNWRFDPENVDGEGHAIGDFNVIAIVAEPSDTSSRGTSVTAPLIGFIDKQKVQWKHVLLNRMQTKEITHEDEALEVAYKEKLEKIMEVTQGNEGEVQEEILENVVEEDSSLEEIMAIRKEEQEKTVEIEEEIEIEIEPKKEVKIEEKKEVKIEEKKEVEIEKKKEVEIKEKKEVEIEEAEDVKIEQIMEEIKVEIEKEKAKVEVQQEKEPVQEKEVKIEQKKEEYGEKKEKATVEKAPDDTVDYGKMNYYDYHKPNNYYHYYFKMVCGYVKNILKYYPEVEPFEMNMTQCKWWKIDCNQQTLYRNFLPFYGYIGNMGRYYPSMGHMTGCHDLIHRYQHYIFGIVHDGKDEPMYYIYGVPGRFMISEQPYEGMTGFVYWHPLENKVPEKGDYGYWLLHIDVRSGNVAMPLQPTPPPRY